jgi:hypothetical protein
MYQLFFRNFESFCKFALEFLKMKKLRQGWQALRLCKQ